MKKALQWLIFIFLVSIAFNGCRLGGVISPLILTIMALFSIPDFLLNKPDNISDDEHNSQKKTMRIIGLILFVIALWRYPPPDKKQEYAESQKAATAYSQSSEPTNTEKPNETPYLTDSVQSWSEKAKTLHKSRKKRAAISLLTTSLQKVEHSDLLLLQRAKYYAEAGEKENAKSDLDKVKEVNEEYHSLYNKLRDNETPKQSTSKQPQKQITDYCTLCNDGTWSKTCATGRGACSSHGGVKAYNVPRYD